MRVITFLFPILLVTFSANAQKGQNSLSIGPSVGIPLNFSTGYKTGFGGGIRGYFGVTPKGAVLANVNILSFPTKFSEGTGTLTSLKVGYRTYFNSAKFFIFGDGGLVKKSGEIGENDIDFGAGGGIGYSITTGKNGSIDIVPSYNVVFQSVINRTWLDFHLAYRFKL